MLVRSFFLAAGAAVVLFAVGCTSEGADQGTGRTEANVTAKPRARFVCREYDRKTEALKPRTVVLEQTDDQGLTEGKKLKFLFGLYEGSNVVAERELGGTAETEDVNFHFAAADGSVGFRMFFDELEESSLTLDGKDAGDFLCSTGHMVCHEYDRKTEQLGQKTIVLNKKTNAPVEEGKKIPFELETFTGTDVFGGTSTLGTVETEDVMFDFTSNDGKTHFHTFLDEANESGLSIDGKDAGDYICR